MVGSENRLTNNMLLRMEVVKRDGRREKVSFDKIIRRIEGICEQLNLVRVDPIEIAKETIQNLYDGVKTEELDFFAAHKCAEKIIDDPEYNKLAAGLCISNLHKNTANNFMDVTNKLYNNVDRFGKSSPLVTNEYYNFVKNNIKKIDDTIDYKRDYIFDFFGVKTMERAYMLRLKTDKFEANDQVDGLKKKRNNKTKDEIVMKKKHGEIVERPQHIFMREACGIHFIDNDIEAALESYYYLSNKYFTHASPTIYNAGNPRPQLSSCFLLGVADSIDGIFETISDVAKISKWAGGIGVDITPIRASGSLIRGTNGNSDGIVPLARVFNSVAKYVNQGGRRNGAVALYMEPFHPDILDFCELRKNSGLEEKRARDIFTAIWAPDIFMRRVMEDEMWSLMCPDECPDLINTSEEEFEVAYLKYEKEGRYKKQIKASELWYRILTSQFETGTPYFASKDNANKMSNQKNIGKVKSNLCIEIMEVATPDEIAVCNLSSICLPAFINKDKTINHEELCKVAGIVTRNLNKIIDINYYPVEKAKKSNMRHRPIGIGIQGLADVYCKLFLPFDSEEANLVNQEMMETIYYGALKASCELAQKLGPYETFKGSPFSEGKLQYHLAGLTEDDLLTKDRWDWKGLVEDIKQYGTRNSLVTALMPTASTSQLMGNNECFEPYTTNLYTRSTLAGEYLVVNQHLVEKLIELGLWNDDVKEEFIYDNGSIQHIRSIPQEVKDVYKTAFEMSMKPTIDQAIARQPFIDQSQSMNLFISEPDFEKLTNALFYGWKHGLKTLMYYLRTRPAVNPQKFGLDPERIARIEKKRYKHNLKYNRDNDGAESDSSDDDRPDPRRVDEIRQNQEKHMAQNDYDYDYEPCEFCSG